MTPVAQTNPPKLGMPLPQGWRWTKLGEVCAIIAGQSPPGETYRKTPDGLPFFQGKADFGARHPIARTWCASPTKIAQPGDILMSVRAPVGPTNVADVQCCIGRGLAAIRPGVTVDREFVLATLKHKEQDLVRLGSGSTFQSINREHLESLPILLPPLPEQKRIATILTEQMSAVDKARAAAEVQLEAAEVLNAARLRAIFNQDLMKSWPSMPLGSVGEIVSGVTLGRKFRGSKVRSVPYLRVANVKDGHLDLENVKEVDATESEINKLRLRRGDILLTEGGDPDKLGRGTFWEDQLPECIHQNHIFRVRFDQKIVSPQFVSAQIGSPYGKAYFLAHAKQTTGIATINQKVLAGFPLRLPPRGTQDRIIALLEERVRGGKILTDALRDRLAAIRLMVPALLQRAFIGEL